MPDQTLIIPAPAEWLNSNDHRTWPVRARLTKTWRQAACWRAIAAMRRGELTAATGPVTITATVHRGTNRGRSDAHNRQPTIKAVLDGLVDANLLRDDSDRYITRLSIDAGDRVHGGQLTITITPAGEAP